MADVEAGLYTSTTRFKSLMVHQRYAIGARAALAIDICKMMMVGGEPAEHQQGDTYQQIKAITPEQAVDRAIRTTALLFDELEKREWLTISPEIKNLLDDQPAKTGF